MTKSCVLKLWLLEFDQIMPISLKPNIADDKTRLGMDALAN
jgi:hypothetical protein